jgi:arylsulfatase A-like enzyme
VTGKRKKTPRRRRKPSPPIDSRQADDDLPGWQAQHLRLGVAMGLGLGVCGQWVIAWLMPGAMDSSWLARAVGIACSTGLWAMVALGLSLVSASRVNGESKMRGPVLLSASVLATLTIVQLTGVVLRVLSGSFLTMGAVMFALGSSEHFLRAATGDYATWFMAAAAVWLGLVVVLARYLARAASRSARRPAGPISGFAVLLLALLTLVVMRGHSRFLRSVFVSGPLLALVSSLDEDFSLGPTATRPDALAAPLAPPGPALERGAEWLSRARQHRGQRPNVLLLMLESVSPSRLGYAGHARKTPAIDRLAYGGWRMTRAWTTATHSNYAQMAVLSSLFPRRGQGLDVYRRLDYPRVLFHDVFHALGYDTATISSQDEDWQGMRRFQQTETPNYFWYSADHRGPLVDTGTEKIVPDDMTTDVLLDWLSRRKEQPWALYVNFQGTHFPYTISDEARRPYKPDLPTWSTFTYLRYPESERQIVVNRFHNALAHVDDQVGRIYRYLQDVGELDDTLWIVTSDHGELFFDKGLVTHGRTLYEAEARVPLLLHWPAGLQPEERNEPVSHLDILPTTLELLGLPPHPAFQGRSFVQRGAPLATSAGDAQPAIFLNIQGLRFADAIVCWPYKLILERTSEKQYLFDLARDPIEATNLLTRLPETAARLADTLNRQLRAQLDYHEAQADELRRQRYQPRLRACPRLPAK